MSWNFLNSLEVCDLTLRDERTYACYGVAVLKIFYYIKVNQLGKMRRLTLKLLVLALSEGITLKIIIYYRFKKRNLTELHLITIE